MFSANLNAELRRAVVRGDLNRIKLYLIKGADINARGVGGLAALHWAVMIGHTDIVECLLINGADITAITTIITTGHTALHLAARNDWTDTAKLLLQHNAGLLGIRGQIVRLLKLLNSPQLNAMQPNAIEILYPHPNKAEHWITTPMELEELPPENKVALAYKWPDGAARSATIPCSIRVLTKEVLSERRAIRLATEYCAVFRKLKQLFEEKPTLRKETLGALSNEKEKTEYNSIFFAFDVFKNTPPHLQLQICMKATGANQEPTGNEVNAAMGRLKAI